MSSGWQQRAPAHPSPVESDSSCVKQKDGCSSQALLKQEQHDLQVFTWDSIQSGSSNDLVQDNTPSSAMSEGLPPRVLLTITKLQCQLETKQQRIAALERQVEDLMQDRNFLRNQIENLTSNRTLAAYAPPTHTPGAKSSRGQHSEPRARKRERSPSSSSLSNCSDSESSGSSEAPDNSSERRRKKHPKTKKRGKNGKDFRRKRATDVRYIVQRYQKVLEAFVKKKNMTEAFQRCGVDRNTIANTASIVELHLAAPDPSLLVGPFRPGEDTLVSYAQRCTLVIDSDAQLARRIDQMKASGELLPISGKRSRGLQPHFLPLGGGVDSIVL